jgi:hypothetical protein
MNKTRRLGGKLGIMLCGALFGCAAYGQPSVSVGVSVALPTVQIRTDSDFYEPLAPDGQWLMVGSYGRCWRPAHVARDWRPYCDGSWVWTDAGWYWASDEPWAWATYHYGCWGYSDQFGWYWVPQTQWAPAWVSWHQGGGYIGWTPRYPSGMKVTSTRAYVMVKQDRFLDSIRPTTVIVNTTAIIKHTSALSNTREMNNTRFNAGPTAAFVEKASGRKLQPVPFQELRHKQEAVVGRQPARATTPERKIQAPVNTDGGSRENKTVPTHVSPMPKPAPENHEVKGGSHQQVSGAPETKPDARPDHNQPPAIKKSTQPKAGQSGQQPAHPPANDNGGANPPDNGHGNNH